MKSITSLIHLHYWFISIAGALIIPSAFATPALAATSITAEYGIIERSVSVNSLQAYAVQGTINPDLRAFIHALNPGQREQLKLALMAKVDLSEVTVSQFLYTAQGETLLKRMGEVIRTDANLSGFYGIRGAIILAAADPDGLTLLNVLKKFPLEDIRVDLNRALRISSDLETLVRQSQTAIATVEQQSNLEASQQPWQPFPNSPNLRSPGSFTWQKLTITVNNASRNRTLLADVYLPLSPTREPVKSAPVIVISHGLGGDRSDFAYLAEQLASYGFAVAVPQHPGSDAQQIQALLAGETNQVIDPNEFVDRPLDITDLLNTLTSLSQTDSRFSGRLNLQDVGVIGQSLGGYTALALAGAKFNIPQLTADCSQRDTFNLSLLLECQAQELPQPLLNLRDGRVKAIFVVNPIGSSIFGESGYHDISIPTLIVSGSNDTVAPALLEQIRPFTWLTTPNKYLVLLQGGTHFSTIDTSDSSADTINLPANVIGPDPTIAYAYLKAMSVAFFETYLTNHSNYHSYLSAAYAKSISQPLMPIDLVRSLPSE